MGGNGEEAGAEALRALQLARLKVVVARAYDRVPHYREKFARAGLHPDDLRGLDDLAKFPFTSKDDLRATYPFGMFAVPMEEIVRIHASSGTTGKPTVVGYTKGDIATWSHLMARSIRAAGGRPSDKVHNAYGYGLFTGGLGFHYGAEHLGAAVIPAGGGFTGRQVQLINDFRPDIILATPSYMLTIADAFERQGLDPRRSGLRIGMFGAEPWSEGMREEIERRVGLAAMNHYGLSEVMGPGVAQERIEAREGMTVWEDHFYPEIIDPETGRVLPDGEQGELVLSTLTKEGMPVIRYRTRDLTRLLPPANGASMRRIDRVTGRTDDMLIVRGVNVFPSQIEAVLTKDARVAPHYLLELRRPGRLDELDVVVETRAAAAEGAMTSAEHEKIEANLERLIKGFVGVTARVRVVPPGTIERSEGKARRVVDLRAKG
ncbi:MAG TPA: phenylacetate--CoA ligase PaaK [Acetobacteraceae bacterium]|nr:phenylacetate--CoA ligase PaaK [Acetobacteraceae bacterium]